MELATMFLVGYVVGSLPTAYLIYRVMSGSDITKHGTGNVGARNIYDVTGKKWPGIVTLLIDAGKGAFVVALAGMIYPESFGAVAFASVGAVVGHNYSFLLKGKGGRGLATALGVSTMVNPIMPLTWFIMYFMGYFVIKKNVHVGAMTAILASSVLLFSLPDLVLAEFSLVPFGDPMNLRLFGVAVLFPLFLKHLDPIRELIRVSNAEDES